MVVIAVPFSEFSCFLICSIASGVCREPLESGLYRLSGRSFGEEREVEFDRADRGRGGCLSLLFLEYVRGVEAIVRIGRP